MFVVRKDGGHYFVGSKKANKLVQLRIIGMFGVRYEKSVNIAVAVTSFRITTVVVRSMRPTSRENTEDSFIPSAQTHALSGILD